MCLPAIGQDFPESPGQIDAYLQEVESSFTDLIEGTEKRVIWVDQPGKPTELSLIYLHGFSGSNRESAPYANQLAEALGANLFYTRLAGHGRSEDAMLDGSVDHWIEDTTEAYRIGTLIGGQVVVIGLSTGGTLATWLAAQEFSDKLGAMILVSPNFKVADERAWILEWSLGLWLIKWWHESDYYEFAPSNEQHARYWTERYPVDVLPRMLELVSSVDSMAKETLEIPVKIFYAEGDRVVDVEAIKSVFSEWGSETKQLEGVQGADDPYQHVLAGDILSPNKTEELVQQSEEFIRLVVPLSTTENNAASE